MMETMEAKIKETFSQYCGEATQHVISPQMTVPNQRAVLGQPVCEDAVILPSPSGVPQNSQELPEIFDEEVSDISLYDPTISGTEAVVSNDATLSPSNTLPNDLKIPSRTIRAHRSLLREDMLELFSHPC